MNYGDRLLALGGGVVGGAVVAIAWCVVGARVPAVITVREVGLVVRDALRGRGK